MTGAKVSSEADCLVLPELFATTAKTLRVREVSADKADLSRKNLEAIDRDIMAIVADRGLVSFPV